MPPDPPSLFTLKRMQCPYQYKIVGAGAGVPAVPILLLVTTLYVGINILKPTLSATDYMVPLSGMPEMLQNSTITWKMILYLYRVN